MTHDELDELLCNFANCVDCISDRRRPYVHVQDAIAEALGHRAAIVAEFDRLNALETNMYEQFSQIEAYDRPYWVHEFMKTFNGKKT